MTRQKIIFKKKIFVCMMIQFFSGISFSIGLATLWLHRKLHIGLELLLVGFFVQSVKKN